MYDLADLVRSHIKTYVQLKGEIIVVCKRGQPHTSDPTLHKRRLCCTWVSGDKTILSLSWQRTGRGFDRAAFEGSPSKACGIKVIACLFGAGWLHFWSGGGSLKKFAPCDPHGVCCISQPDCCANNHVRVVKYDVQCYRV